MSSGARRRPAARGIRDPDASAEILNAAMAPENRPIESGTLEKAQSYDQSARLSAGRVHTGPHIFFGAGAEHDTATAFHEFGHLDKNTRGFAETGTANGSGVPVTSPNQHSEREAANGAAVTPSVAAQSAASAASGSDAAIQRATVQRMERRPAPDAYEADHSSSGSDHGRDSDGSPARRERDLQDLIDRTEIVEPVSFARRRPPPREAGPLFPEERPLHRESSFGLVPRGFTVPGGSRASTRTAETPSRDRRTAFAG